jgi:hypothetical protein
MTIKTKIIDESSEAECRQRRKEGQEQFYASLKLTKK